MGKFYDSRDVKIDGETHHIEVYDYGEDMSDDWWKNLVGVAIVCLIMAIIAIIPIP